MRLEAGRKRCCDALGDMHGCLTVFLFLFFCIKKSLSCEIKWKRTLNVTKLYCENIERHCGHVLRALWLVKFGKNFWPVFYTFAPCAIKVMLPSAFTDVDAREKRTHCYFQSLMRLVVE